MVEDDAIERRYAAFAAERSKPGASAARRSSASIVAGIFINYRRDDSAGYAGRLADDLSKQFGADRVFMDVTDIAPGADFRKEIERQMAACGVTLVMIGKSWLTDHGNDGARRLSKADDFVRLEIATALKRDISVIPVLVDGAAMPGARDLPPDLEALAWRNAVELRHAYWESDLRVLVAALRQIVPESENAAMPTSAAASAQVAASDVAPAPAPATATALATTRWRTSIFATAGSIALALVVGVALISQRPAQPVDAPPALVTPGSAPDSLSATRAAVAPASAAVATPPVRAVDPGAGRVIVSAVGLADASTARYRGDTSSLQRDALTDSNRQVIEKALGLLVDRQSLAANYDALETLLSNSDDYIESAVRQNDPRIGKDGFVSVTTQAVVNVKALQKSLNEMSRRDRLELIRARGDPKISLSISVRDSDQLGAPAHASSVAENILKERIKSFGFRTWSDDAPSADARRGMPDYTVRGEAGLKKLSMRLEASGIVITKFTLTSWTVKCVDRATGEEIYFNTTLPIVVGSWPSEEQALRAIGAKVADEFSRDFFLDHLGIASRTAVIAVDGMPNGAMRAVFERELVGLPAVIAATAQPSPRRAVYELHLAGGGAIADIVAAEVLKPLNAKLGQPCFGIGAVQGDQVTIVFDGRCGEHPILARLETYPPAGLYGAPMGRRLAVVKNPDTLRKLTT